MNSRNLMGVFILIEWINNDMRLRELFETQNRTLFHGTLQEFVPDILEIGLVPSLGEFTKHAYDEYVSAGIEMPKLVFAADKDGISGCFSAIIGAMRQKKIKLTPENFLKHAAILIIKDSSRFQHRDGDGSDDWDNDRYPQVEPGDYFTDRSVSVDFVLTGKKVMDLFRRYGGRGSYWFGSGAEVDPNGYRARLVKRLIAMRPNEADHIRQVAKTGTIRDLENLVYSKKSAVTTT
jgi:hypothetical protein